jgi:hypothetical protein
MSCEGMDEAVITFDRMGEGGGLNGDGFYIHCWLKYST